MGLWRFIQSLKETAEETTSTIRWLLGVFLILAVIGVAFGKWISGLNTLQIASFYIGIGIIVLIGITFLVDWNTRRNIYRIPDLLALIDELTLDLIDEYEFPKENEDVTDDLAKVIGTGDINQLKSAVREKRKSAVESELTRMNNHYNSLVNSKKPQEALQNLLLTSGFLNSHDIGLKRVTNTPRYNRLYKTIKTLQKRVPSANINMKINEYWKWSEGLYSLILTTKPLMNIPGLKELMPPKYLASSSMMRPQIQDFTTVLISGVRESIESYKERERGLNKNNAGPKKS